MLFLIYRYISIYSFGWTCLSFIDGWLEIRFSCDLSHKLKKNYDKDVKKSFISKSKNKNVLDIPELSAIQIPSYTIYAKSQRALAFKEQFRLVSQKGKHLEPQTASKQTEDFFFFCLHFDFNVKF